MRWPRFPRRAKWDRERLDEQLNHVELLTCSRAAQSIRELLRFYSVLNQDFNEVSGPLVGCDS